MFDVPTTLLNITDERLRFFFLNKILLTVLQEKKLIRYVNWVHLHKDLLQNELFFIRYRY